jgi:hypothetical protein
VIDYNIDRYINMSIIDPSRKKEVKFKFCAFNSTIKASGFYFNEKTSEDYASDTTNTLFRMYLGPYKRLELRNSIFDLMNQVVFTYEGVNIEMYNVTVNASR